MNVTNVAQYYDQHMMEYQNLGWGIFMMIFFIVIICAAVIVILRYTTNDSNMYQKGSEPLDIAKSRYAKGEITKAQFEDIKKVLKL